MKNKKSIKSLCLALPLILGLTGIRLEQEPTGGAHEHNNITFTEWTSTTEMPSSAGNYYLANDVELQARWEVPEGEINLCLNGNVLTIAPQEVDQYDLMVINKETTLTIYDCNPTKPNYFKEETIIDDHREVVRWVHDDTLTGDAIKHTVNGGVITGGVYRAINMFEPATLTMHGGTICNSDSYPDYGGAVMMYGGTFNMYDGVTLDQNYAPFGGAVHVYSYDNAAVFNMYGGTISNNIASDEGGAIELNGIFNMYGGEIINNTCYGLGGAIHITNPGVFNMYDGLISGNIGCLGGAICVGDAFGECECHIKGGRIIGNRAVDSLTPIEDYDDDPTNDEYETTHGVGGAILVMDGSIFTADGGTISTNSADTAGGGIYLSMPSGFDPYYCVTEGTKVTLGDGTTTNVENLKIGDEIRVFDHKNGELSTSEIFYLEKSEDVTWGVVTLKFTNDINVSIVQGHSFFSKEENKYVTITPSNVDSYVGKEFYNADNARWETLTSYEEITEPIDSYSVVTKENINFITNGMLSCGDELYLALSNIFEFDENLKYDATQKALDIETYGLFEFEECQFATRETYDALNLKYLKVALGKEVLTPEYISMAAEYQTYNGSGLVNKRNVILGGTVVISENTCGADVNNVAVWANKGCQVIQVGTGIEEGCNGVKKPETGMLVGVSLINRTDDTNTSIMGPVSINGTVEDAKYFDADLEGKVVESRNGRLVIVNPPVEIPTFESNIYVHTGNEIDFNIPTNDLYEITGATKATDCGTYEVKLALKDKEYTTWSDDSTDDITYTFVVKNAPVAKPTFETTTFVHTGNEIDFNIPTNDLYEITGATKATAPGTYEVKLALKDKEYTTWSDDSTDDLTFVFIINQKAEDVEIQIIGDSPVDDPVVIVEAEKGINPEAILVVKVVKIDSETEIQQSMNALNNENKIGENEELFGLYDAKLLIDGVETQPDGTIKIKMYVPEELQGKTFKLFHIHAGTEVMEITYQAVQEGEYLTFETDKLSQFAFIGEVEQPHVCEHVCPTCGKCKDANCTDPVCADKCTCVEPTPDSPCFIHWIMIAVLVIGLVLFVVFGFVLKNRLATIITCITGLVISIVLAFFGKCVVCTVFTIVNIIVFILGLIYVLFIKKEKKEKEEDNDEGTSLKDSLGVMASVAIKGNINKKFIADYLKNKYGKDVVVNCRANTTKPGRGQTVGLPLADTHYVFLNKKDKKCFIYVYENDEGKVMLLINTTKKYFEELCKEHKHITKSLFPKSKDNWYTVIIDDTWNIDNVSVLLDNLIKIIKEN